MGDHFLVDTEENLGYLIHPDGSWTSFIVATGQRRIVWYIGRVYNATTPEREWVMQEINFKGPSVTFGNGLFMRLYFEGETTPYGIHGHRYSNTILARDERFASMGCIIVSDEILELLRLTYAVNDGRLKVTTTYGLGKMREVFP